MARHVLTILMLLSLTAEGQLNRQAAVRTQAAASAYDPDAQSYFSRLEAVGFTPTTTDKQQVNHYIVGLKNAGIWDKITGRYLLFWNHADAVRVPMKEGVPNLALLSTATYDNTGTVGTFNSGVLGSDLPLHDVHLCVYSQTNSTSGNGDIGCRTTSNINTLVIVRNSANMLSSQIYTTSASTGYLTASNTSSLGYFITSRVSSTDHRVYFNGAQLGATATTANATSRPTHALYIGGWNNAGTLSTTGRKYSLQGFGRGLTAAESATDNTLTEQLMDARGIGVQ